MYIRMKGWGVWCGSRKTYCGMREDGISLAS